MNLIERMKRIAETEGISLDDISLKRAAVFLKEHESHNATDIAIGVGNNEVKYIKLSCGSKPSLYSITVYESGR